MRFQVAWQVTAKEFRQLLMCSTATQSTSHTEGHAMGYASLCVHAVLHFATFCLLKKLGTSTFFSAKHSAAIKISCLDQSI
jgi:hypothetical protein